MEQSASNSMGAIRARISKEWTAAIANIPPDIQLALQKVVLDNEQDLIRRYRAYLVDDQEIWGVIASEQGREEFTERFTQWVKELVKPAPTVTDSLIRHQEEVGEMMARVGYPPHAISRAARKLKLWMISHVQHLQLSHEKLMQSVDLIINLIDLSLELRQIGYQASVVKQSRIDEAYRLFALGQNLAMEKERQRALLMEWGNTLLMSFHHQSASESLPRLWKSEFGLWLNHKGRVLFEKAPKINLVMEAVNRIDDDWVPLLEATDHGNRAIVGETIRKIDEDLLAIKFGLNSIFEAYMEIENGRDPLTQLLNRRFMPSVLMREISLQKSAMSQGLGLLMIDIDHFKEVNDTHGHAIGDLVLQQVAAEISSKIRPSDFAFRYGGEEIMVVLVDCTPEISEQIAEKIRLGVETLSIAVPEQEAVKVTISIGVSNYQGELDYEQLVVHADEALYEAKHTGRNKVVLSPLAQTKNLLN